MTAPGSTPPAAWRRTRWRAACVAESEPFVPVMAERIGEIPVQREHGILHQRIHAEMEALDRFAPSGHAFECGLELSEVRHLDHQMELAEPRGAEAELAPRQTPALDQTLLLEVAQV